MSTSPTAGMPSRLRIPNREQSVFFVRILGGQTLVEMGNVPGIRFNSSPITEAPAGSKEVDLSTFPTIAQNGLGYGARLHDNGLVWVLNDYQSGMRQDLYEGLICVQAATIALPITGESGFINVVIPAGIMA